MAIVWDPQWNIGYDEVDQQHQKWLDIFNQLESAFLNGRFDPASQHVILKQLIDYTRYHFTNEEELMARIKYPNAPAHWRLHKEFDTLVYDKFRLIENGEILLTSDLLLLMKNWLINHILTEDQKIAAFIHSCR